MAHRLGMDGASRRPPPTHPIAFSAAAAAEEVIATAGGGGRKGEQKMLVVWLKANYHFSEVSEFFYARCWLTPNNALLIISDRLACLQVMKEDGLE